MGSFAATILSLCGITGGTIIAVASAFFALVIPKKNGEG